MVGDKRFGRPIIGVGILVAWTLRRGRPRRPSKERSERMQVTWIGDRRRPQPVFGRRLPEVGGVVFQQISERGRLRGGKLQRPTRRIIPVRAEIRDRARSRVIGPRSAIGLLYV